MSVVEKSELKTLNRIKHKILVTWHSKICLNVVCHMTGFIISFIWQKQRSFLQSLKAELLPRSTCIRFASAAEHSHDRCGCWSSRDITHMLLGKCWGSSNDWHNSLLGNFCIWCRNQNCTSADLAASSWSSQFHQSNAYGVLVLA